ncbi:hypothetical protein ACQ3I4_09485 [Zafaria sp. Z1313]|uniref:hypothetical protein n=1 Tax=unclassified Zafaria TaxID=2828765 RepID=UPI002E7711F1|nr:hypothetical protein [Zafaria sp. J156]MEE1622666.1 hypothetical protein [Zafaria sp. J156]
MEPEDFRGVSEDDRNRKTKSFRADVEAWVIGFISLVALLALLHASVEYAGW